MFNTKNKIENDYWDGVFESVWERTEMKKTNRIVMFTRMK